MIPLSVPEIEGGPLSVTDKEKEQKDWSWSILVVGLNITLMLATRQQWWFWCTQLLIIGEAET